jgi:drug/metabolite transporter (DMT)-like permease
MTWIFLGTRYSLWQIFGVALGVLGLGLVLLSDAGVGGGGDNFSSTSQNFFFSSIFWVIELMVVLQNYFFFFFFLSERV